MTRQQLTRLRRTIPRMERYRAKLLDAQERVGDQLSKMLSSYQPKAVYGWPPRLGMLRPSQEAEAAYQVALQRYVALSKAINAGEKPLCVLRTFAWYYSDREREARAAHIEKRMAQAGEWYAGAKKLLRKVK